MTLSKKAVGILAACMVVILTAGLAIGLNWDGITGGGRRAAARGVGMTVDPAAEDWHGRLPEEQEDTQALPSEPEEVPSVQIPGYGALEFAAGTKEQEVSFVNPEGNGCYFVISVALPDGTPLYTSQLIPPGKGLYHITLDRELGEGEYENAQLQYRCISLEDGRTEYNGANVNLTLRVV